jgi:hypothetical protein
MQSITPFHHLSLLSSLHCLSNPHPSNKHIQHPPHLPRILARLDRNLDSLHKRHDKIIHLLAPAQLIGVQVQYYERDIGSEARNTVVADVFYAPPENGLEGEGVAV